MEIVNTKTVAAHEGLTYELKTIFDRERHGIQVAFGIVTLPPGGRIPESGYSAHDTDEYAFVTKGTVLLESSGNHRLEAGDASYIRAGEQHWVQNDGLVPAEVVWALVGEVKTT